MELGIGGPSLSGVPDKRKFFTFYRPGVTRDSGLVGPYPLGPRGAKPPYTPEDISGAG